MHIGDGEIGGKARGLLLIRDVLNENLERLQRPGVRVGIPTMTVITSTLFDAFLHRNGLREVAAADLPDDRMAHAFQKADLPVELVGDLRALTEEVRSPLAIRSSSLLEDSLFRPFAGVYATKMIPNNQADPNARFRVLVEAIKYVYASTFFRDAKAYRLLTGEPPGGEKMSIVIQEVVGLRHFNRFYPDVSGVARSYNYYPVGGARRDEGVVNLAHGLGKTIVDGGVTWAYSPARPRTPPPFASAADLVKNTQSRFWAVNMGPVPDYDPLHETEYLEQGTLADADLDGTLRYVASTFQRGSDRIVPGVGADGPRAVTFAPLLELDEWPVNDIVRELLGACEESLGAPVEIEFAVTFDAKAESPVRIAFLQVRPMVIPTAEVHLTAEELAAPDVLVASDRVLGNGVLESIRDVVYVKPEGYDPAGNRAIAKEAEAMNRRFLAEGRGYLLVGFGRWGSSDFWLGSPVTWGQICGAQAVVEASLPSLPGDLSQGSHFFHNVSSFGVPYFMVRHDAGGRIDWEWLERQPREGESENLCHVRLEEPLVVKVDGRTGCGLILRR